MAGVSFGILGDLDVRDDHGRPVPIPGSRQRAALSALLWHGGTSVSAMRLVQLVWGTDGPADPKAALHTCMSRLRRALPEPDRLQHSSAGYRLDLDGAELDLVRFRALVQAADQRRARGEHAVAATQLREALSLWRGQAFAGLDGFLAARGGLAQERLDACEQRIECELQLGRHAEMLADLRQLVVDHPGRERLHGLLMLALYRSARQSDALEAYRTARDVLLEQLGVEPGPALRELHARLLRQDAALVGSAPEVQAAGNLPHPPTSLVGRDEAVVALRRLVMTARLVTLVGPGGTGKTRLAVELARALEDDHPDGTWFVELAPVATAGLVPRQVADSLGLALEPDRAVLPPLVEHCRRRALLLVLDNAEHLLDATAHLVVALQRECPQLRVLVTSRESLACDGEHLWEVPTLEVPGPSTPDCGRDMTRYSAVELFRQRATAVAPRFELTPANREAVACICQRLDGLPLAIELAAARVSTTSCAQIADQLATPGSMLEAVRRGGSPRHRTLRATLDWSYDLLAESERHALRHLAVFVSGFSPVDAQAVTGAHPASGVGPLLQRLRSTSLLVADEVEDERYRMLEPVRQYGMQRLAEAGETDAARAAHAARQCSIATSTEPVLRNDPPRGPAVSAELERGHGDLRAALDWAVSGSHVDTALTLAGNLWIFWWSSGHMIEGIERLTAVLALPGGQQAPRARAATGLAFLASQDFRWTVARTYAQVALDAFVVDELRASSAHHAYALFVQAEVLTHDRRFDAASRAVEGGLAVVQATDDGWGYAFGSWVRANLAFEQGDLDRAHAGHSEMLAAMRAIGLPVAMVAALHSLGTLELARGRYAEARRHLDEAVELRRQSGADRLGRYHGSTASELRDLAVAALAQDDRAAARRYAEDGAAAARPYRDHEILAACLAVLDALGE